MSKKRTPSQPVPQDLSADLAAAELFSVGHAPAVTLSPEQENLFKSFQSNLVSLLSHELRTPLMGILNALSALDEEGEPLGGMSRAEALGMARVQASKLESALSTVLDLAAWEAGSLQIEKREGDFARLAGSVFGQAVVGTAMGQVRPSLLDEARLRRALLRLREVLEALGELSKGGAEGGALELSVRLRDAESGGHWDKLWHEVQVARAAHASLPLHVFAGVLQNEQGFLARTREGLGAELHLVAQILAQHEARFEATRQGLLLSLVIGLPAIEGRVRVLEWLRGRIWKAGVSEPSELSLRVVRAGGGAAGACQLAPGQWLEVAPGAVSGWIQCPRDGVDAAALLELALR